jgi:SNF2 family DNA or RNA helicase
LPGRIRLATSGTPIENRLSELWSIFRFLNPGLLGSLASFRRRFEMPMSQSGGRPGESASAPRQRLRRLVGPFLLRRTKSEVLRELPPRTEIPLTVELSVAERSLYEEIREEAERSLSSETKNLKFDILAQLMRLRQACCHPRLLLSSGESSKFEAFFTLAEDLLAGRHRVLVFSQFVQLLKLLEEEMQQRNLSYLFLDGSTPTAVRRQRVEAFQGGEGDFFLISLKAGGTGLNLTGADYVIHLDPWWNPAAEDQASDRAHRIGQTRPVTIYRLIAKDTIEEKVIQLHGVKRQLAQGVLEGSDGKAALSASDLLELLRP